MKKKEILEKLNNLKTRYIYQRYNGIIKKYEVRDNYLINTGNANNTIDINRQIPLGKTSENIIDLIEVGDIVEYIDEDGEYIKDFIIKKHTPVSLISFIEYLKAYCKVITILTHEQYEQNCYKVVE